ncbi:outer membrane protein assembly factor BamD [Oecophyllibacter saccharovorans]|uniref:Outer membrane protein assembly factor BamD n=1 Tax=Oecophyllibacter saccharovorans TaxID=2558360 RepID=A0A506US61_9PROT|nr:outer membrane protein assembly factor BamD [Oecophyllibacter saccharovorans]QDH15907.1 outer membrane protein assembly factor BamD [Oecophyllibacter saccharovorans]TPW35339.1 outer membrane protein assembly factor BamD [Oecophyllibacter saccharovorans]TPW36181.1 outer membrane protein assembly factor BamD [Oecophyllibacter saccharovorans]
MWGSRLCATGLCATLAVPLLAGCASDDISKQIPQSADAETLYNDGIDALRTGHYKLASAEFELIQQNFPYSGYTGHAELMEGYAYYLQGEYALSVQQLERFLQLHPTSPDAAYAYYLRALCYYEQIGIVARDQLSTVEAMEALEEVVARFPQTSYARDARLKIDLCRDHLAGKEMYVGRYYERMRDYQGAYGRYQRVIQDYQTTNHVPEALERLVEVTLDLGLINEARQDAAVLGYNYPDSKWYRFAYNKLKNHDLLTPETRKPGKDEAALKGEAISAKEAKEASEIIPVSTDAPPPPANTDPQAAGKMPELPQKKSGGFGQAVGNFFAPVGNFFGSIWNHIF